MCRDDGEPVMGCDCDYCIGFGQGYMEGHADGKRSGMSHANSFHGIAGGGVEVGDFDYEAEVKQIKED